jgi:hypothetical protein
VDRGRILRQQLPPSYEKLNVACCVSFRRSGRIVGSVTTVGDSLFAACSTALEFFNRDFWQGWKPGPGTILECYAMGTGKTYKVRAGRVLDWRRINTEKPTGVL